MTILSDTTLETMTYDAPGWCYLYNANVDKINEWFSKIQFLGDVNTENLKDGSILTWDDTAGEWVCRNYE